MSRGVYRRIFKPRAKTPWIGTEGAAAAETFISLGPNLPEIEIMVDFDHNPSSDQTTWTDIGSQVRSFSIKRGRENELTASSPGSLFLTISNTDGRWDPTNSTGPYFGKLLPMRRIRVRCRFAGTIYALFRGYITEFPLSYPEMGRDAIVELEAVDAFRVLNLHDLVGQSYASHAADTRIAAVLGDAGFGAGEYNLRVAQTTLAEAGVFPAESYALSHLQDVAATESGPLFVNGSGLIRFHDRHYRNNLTSSGTISTTGIPFRDPTIYYGDRRIWNVARVTPAIGPAGGGIAEEAINAASTAIYYPRTLNKSSLASTQNEAAGDASYMVYRHGTALLEVEQVTVMGGAATAQWPTILAREISDVVTFSYAPLGSGTITQNQHIEQIGFDVSVERRFDVIWRMSNADPSFWVLDSATKSQLNSTTIVGF